MKKFVHAPRALVTLALICSTSGFYPPQSAYAIGGGGISTVTGGAVNCKAENTCIQNIGDTAHVSYKIQTSAFLLSGNRALSVPKTSIFVPKILKNVKFTLVSAPGSKTNTIDTGAHPQKQELTPTGIPIYRVPVHKVSKNIPVVSLVYNNNAGFCDEHGNQAPLDKGGFISSDIYEQDMSIYKSSAYVDEGEQDSGVSYFGYQSTASDLKNYELYDEYSFELKEPGVFTLKLEGDVETKSTLTVLPIRVTNVVARCVQETNGSDVYEPDCQSLTEYEQFKYGALPKYSLSDDTINQELLKHNTEDGLTGYGNCRVTREIDAPDMIGPDVVPGKTSAFEAYKDTFALEANAAESYFLNGVDEDGCDQAAAVITVCPKPTPTPEPTPTPTPTSKPTPKPDPEQTPHPKEPPTTSKPPVPSTSETKVTAQTSDLFVNPSAHLISVVLGSLAVILGVFRKN